MQCALPARRNRLIWNVGEMSLFLEFFSDALVFRIKLQQKLFDRILLLWPNLKHPQFNNELLSSATMSWGQIYFFFRYV